MPLIYINDFQNCIDNNKAYHFADDTNVIFSKPNIGLLRKALDKQVSIIFDRSVMFYIGYTRTLLEELIEDILGIVEFHEVGGALF